MPARVVNTDTGQIRLNESYPVVASNIVTGAADLTGTGSMTVAGVFTSLGAAALTGNGSMVVAGVHTCVGAAALTGNGTLSTNGTRTRFGVAALTGTGSSTTAGVRTTYSTAALTGTGTLTATPEGAVTTPPAVLAGGGGFIPRPRRRAVLPPSPLPTEHHGSAHLFGAGRLVAIGLQAPPPEQDTEQDNVQELAQALLDDVRPLYNAGLDLVDAQRHLDEATATVQERSLEMLDFLDRYAPPLYDAANERARTEAQALRAAIEKAGLAYGEEHRTCQVCDDAPAVAVAMRPRGRDDDGIRYVGVTYCNACGEPAAQAKLNESFETEPVPA